jgi:hypothetical protein
MIGQRKSARSGKNKKNTMRTTIELRVAAAVMLLPCLAACGGGEEDDGGGSAGFEFDGYFTGTLTPDGSAAINSFLYVAQNGRFYISALPKAQFAGQGTINNTSYTASGMGMSAGFANGSASASFSFTGTIAGQGASLAGAYSGGNESGTYSFQWNQAVSSRAASLGAVAGTYRFPATGTQLFTLTINSTGDYTFSASNGCTMTGRVRVLDSQWNYYSWEATASACPNITGAITGHGWMTADNAVSLFGTQSGLPIYISGTR